MPDKKIVLVVEDEPLQRMAAVSMFEDAGFEVEEAADSTQAVQILENRLDIRVVFSDIDMPRGISGMKLAALIRDRWPPIMIILTSGNFTEENTELPAHSLFFQKPYREKEVVEAVVRLAA